MNNISTSFYPSKITFFQKSSEGFLSFCVHFDQYFRITTTLQRVKSLSNGQEIKAF